MDALRYIIQELPDNPDNVVSEVYFTPGENFSFFNQEHLPWELRDTVDVDLDWYENHGGNI
jgi:hypothetical protein